VHRDWFATAEVRLDDFLIFVKVAIEAIESRLQFGQHLRVPGHGMGLPPSTYCDQALANGALIRLLPKWAFPQIPVFAVYSNRKFLPLRLNVFLNALAAWKSPLWIEE
jgi:DNA-binding transcriptional LysR family regulator